MTLPTLSSTSKSSSLLSSWLAAFLGLLVFLVDQVSKILTANFLPLSYLHSQVYPYGGIGVFKNFLGIEFSITHATNRGAAWGIFAEFQPFLLFLRILLVGGLLLYAVFYNKNRSKLFPLVLIIAGAAGNILDYFIYGHVVDMFHFIFWGYDYPVFNIADSSIFISIVWLFLLSSYSTKKETKTE